MDSLNDSKEEFGMKGFRQPDQQIGNQEVMQLI